MRRGSKDFIGRSENQGVISQILRKRFDEPRVGEVEYLLVRLIDRGHLEGGGVLEPRRSDNVTSRVMQTGINFDK